MSGDLFKGRVAAERLASVHPERHLPAILRMMRLGCERPAWANRRREFAAMTTRTA